MDKAKPDGDHKSANVDRRDLNQLFPDRRNLDRRFLNRRLFSPQIRDGFSGGDRRMQDRRTLARRSSADRRTLLSETCAAFRAALDSAVGPPYCPVEKTVCCIVRVTPWTGNGVFRYPFHKVGTGHTQSFSNAFHGIEGT